MTALNLLYFVEEVSDNHFTFRYGGDVFAVALQQKHWCLLRSGVSTPLDGDNLHDALYQVVRRLQAA